VYVTFTILAILPYRYGTLSRRTSSDIALTVCASSPAMVMA
jgi:hypothetical protein